MKDAGNSYKWIVEHFGVKYSFAYNHLRPSSQATVYRGSVSLDQLEAWANGTQIQKLAEDAGVTPATMGRWLKAHPNYEEYLARRVPRVNREPQNMVARREQMAQEYKAGKSIDAIAELMDVSRQRVHQVLTKHYPELLEERRQQRLKAADDKQKAKLEKLAQRAKVQSQTAQAIELYKQGFTLTEFKHLFPDINWHTFTLHLTAMRQQDPSFPSERQKLQLGKAYYRGCEANLYLCRCCKASRCEIPHIHATY